MARTQSCAFALALALVCGLTGCAGSPAPPTLDASAQNLQVIYRAYKMTEIRTQHTPQKLADIAAHFGDDDPDAVLTSPSDQEPYVIAWGTNTVKNQSALIAYERNGRDGKRFAINSRGHVLTLTEEEFKHAVPAAKLKLSAR
jgi:hypothetical protein